LSEILTIKDKQFRPFIQEAQIGTAVSRIAAKINEELAGDFPVFLAVLNGSFMFASDLLKQVRIPCEISFVKLSSYRDMSSTGTVKEMIGLDADLKDRTVVIVEDIVDSGLTVETLVSQLRQKQVRKLKVAAFLFKPSAFKGRNIPDYVGFEIGEQFVVGYGMDYAGQGRNLKEVHVLA
jgi:hypoxanthine phosphoribosyltransferase